MYQPSSVHILQLYALLTALYGPPAKGSLLAILSRLIGMPSRCHTSRSVLNRLPYCSRLYLTLKTQLTFLSIALSCVLPSTTSVWGTRAKCPGGHSGRGDILDGGSFWTGRHSGRGDILDGGTSCPPTLAYGECALRARSWLWT